MKAIMKSAMVLGGFALLANGNLAFAHGVTNAKALELAFHRVERLVQLCNLGDASAPHNMPGMPGYDPTKCKNDPSKPKKGIEPDFQNKVQSVTLAVLPHQNENEPTFKAIVLQYKAADGSQKSADIVLDEEGRPLSGAANSGGGDAVGAPAWPNKDATSLSENSLHYLEENAASDARLVPYLNGLTKLTLSPGTNSAGAAVAVVDIETTASDPILKIRIKLDGIFESLELVSRTP